MPWQYFNRDYPVEAGVARAVDFAHASGSDESEYLIGPKVTAARERHSFRDFTPRLVTAQTIAPEKRRNQKLGIFGQESRVLGDKSFNEPVP